MRSFSSRSRSIRPPSKILSEVPPPQMGSHSIVCVDADPQKQPLGAAPLGGGFGQYSCHLLKAGFIGRGRSTPMLHRGQGGVETRSASGQYIVWPPDRRFDTRPCQRPSDRLRRSEAKFGQSVRVYLRAQYPRQVDPPPRGAPMPLHPAAAPRLDLGRHQCA